MPREDGFEVGITVMPSLGWQSQAATSLKGRPFPETCFAVVQDDLLGGDLLPPPPPCRELRMSSTGWFPAKEELGAFPEFRAW